MKRLEKSRTDRLLFGVCGGVGEYFGIDPDVVRVLWILLGLLGGIGVLPYVAAIILVPDGPDSGTAPRERGVGRYVGIILITLALVFLLRLVEAPALGLGLLIFWSWDLLLPILLLMGGALLLWPSLRGLIGISSDRPVHRSVSDRVIAGVAGGLAESTGTDGNLVRLVFVLAAALSSGLAILVYLVLIPLLREEAIDLPAPPPPPTPPAPPTPSEPPTSPEPGPVETGPVETGPVETAPKPPAEPDPPSSEPTEPVDRAPDVPPDDQGSPETDR